jgi:hypothetical protein
LIEYLQGCTISKTEGEEIVEQKEKLQEEEDVRKFIGVIHSSVNMKGLDMMQFSTERALKDVEVIGIVFTSNNFIYKFLYLLGVRVINLLVLIFKKGDLKVRAFTNETKAITWAKAQ